LPDCRGPVTVTIGNVRASAASFVADVRRITTSRMAILGLVVNQIDNMPLPVFGTSIVPRPISKPQQQDDDIPDELIIQVSPGESP